MVVYPLGIPRDRSRHGKEANATTRDIQIDGRLYTGCQQDAGDRRGGNKPARQCQQPHTRKQGGQYE
ncbi:MAG: hypothetical protein AXW11_19375 [Marinobacter sp. Hex_13]|nr:MAG: hypothetical protein AXW11_19375 [Marinobacter sp. Hex_13]